MSKHANKQTGRKLTHIFPVGADNLGVCHLQRVVLLLPQLLHHQQVLVTAVLQVDIIIIIITIIIYP